MFSISTCVMSSVTHSERGLPMVIVLAAISETLRLAKGMLQESTSAALNG